ncbi:MAG: Ig-like domain-containing protein [Thiobacillus sp.]
MPPLPFRRRPLIEELEPRLLFSADLAPLALDGTPPAPEQRVIVAESEYTSQTTTLRHELVIVDTGVEDYETLLNDLLKQADTNRHLEVVLLDRQRDGIEQISEALAGRNDLDALHLISHGESGLLHLGNSPLDTALLDARAADLAAWGAALSADADLLLYGCDVAVGSAGETFIGKLSQLTGADVAASADLTGNANLGGDWILESQTGTVESPLLLGSVQTVWQGTLNINAEVSQHPVNATTSNDQTTSPSARQVAMHTDGSFVVVWTSKNQDGDLDGVFMQRFDAAGTPQGVETQVNSFTNGDQRNPVIAMDASGRYVVVWESQGEDGSGYGIYARRFEANGNPASSGQTGEILINSVYTSGDQTDPSVGMDDLGNFAVAWTSNNQDGDGTGIFARRFDTLGNAVGNEFQVNNVTAKNQHQAAVAMNATGAFVIAWTSVDGDGSGNDGVLARLFDAAGNTVTVDGDGGEFKFHPLPLNNQHSADVAMNDNGEFVIALVDEFWGNANVSAWLFNAAGDRQGIGAQLNTQYSSGIQQSPSVALNNDGDFVVVWESENQDGDGYGIVARHFNSSYTAYSDEQIINVVTSANQTSPGVAWKGNQAVFVWSGFGSDDSQGIYFRQAEINTPPVITSNGGGGTANLSIVEGTTAVTTVTATNTDAPAQPLTYSLTGGTDQSAFSIDSGNGTLSFTTPPDFETAGDANGNNVYQVIVQVEDGHGGSDTQTINVTLTNAAPVAQDDSYTTNENTTLSVPTGSGLLSNDADPAGGALSVYTVTQPGHGTVSLIPSLINTSTFVNVSNDPDIDVHGDWSPDGSQIAFASDRDGDYDIYVMNADGSSPVNQTSGSGSAGEDNQPAWSPDGSKIAYMSNTSNGYEVWVMDSNGNNKTKLAGTSTASDVSGQPTWSPDGNQIAFTSTRSGSSSNDIWVANADGSGSPVKLTSTASTDAEPVWSPDGSRIAFSSKSTTTTISNVFVMNANGTGQQQLTFGSGVDKSPVWSPDGSMIAFVSDRTSTSQLYVMNADGSNQTQVTNAATDVTFPDWAPNSNTLLFTVNNEIMTATLVFDGSFIYTPTAGYSGSDSFTYTVTDAAGSARTATVNLTVTAPANTPPSVTPVVLTAIAEDSGARLITQANLLTGASDADGGTLTAIGLTLTSGAGTLSDNGNGTWNYTPALNDDTAASFSFTVSDGQGGAVANTSTLDITPVNDAPVAVNNTAAGNEDTVISGNVLTNDTDVEAATLNAVLIAGPANGSLTLNPNGSFSYTPNANFNGTDTFTYKANDGLADSNSAVVTITVNAVNDAPVAVDDIYATGQATTLTVPAGSGVLVNDSDPENDFFWVNRIVSPVSHGTGTLSASSGAFTYTPDLLFIGQDSFTYEVEDAFGNLSIATVTINVNPVNLAPIALPVTLAAMAEDSGTRLITESELIAGGATDLNGDTLNVTQLLKTSGNGTLIDNLNGTWSYTPALNDDTSVQFSYTVSDGSLTASNTATLDITSVNDAPIASNTASSATEDLAFSGTLPIASDAENDGITYGLGLQATHGVATVNADGSFSYLSHADFNGTDSFTYTVTDGQDSNTYTVSITVAPADDAPVFTSSPLTTATEDSLYNHLVTVSDIDGGTLTISASSLPGWLSLVDHGNGTATLSGTPTQSEVGSHGVTLQVTDVSGLVATQTFTLTVSNVNDAPVSNNASFTALEDTILNGTLPAASDADGQPVSYSLLSPASHGSVVIAANGNFFYTPATDFHGSDGFSFRVSDGNGGVSSYSVTLTVSPRNDAPVSSDAAVTLDEDTTYTFQIADFSFSDPADTPADTLQSVVMASLPGAGSLTLNGSAVMAGMEISAAQITAGQLRFTPAANASGTAYASFDFRIRDTGGTANGGVDLDPTPRTLTLHVQAVNDTPAASSSPLAAVSGSTAIVGSTHLLATDIDHTASELHYVLDALPTSGTLALNGVALAAGSGFTQDDVDQSRVSFTPTGSGGTSETLAFHVTDNVGAQTTVSLSVNIGAPAVVAPTPAPPPEPEPVPQPESLPALNEAGAPSEEAAPSLEAALVATAEATVQSTDKTASPLAVVATTSGATPAAPLASPATLIPDSPALLNTPVLSPLGLVLNAMSSEIRALESLDLSLRDDNFRQQLDQVQDAIRQQLSLDKNTVASTLAVSTGLSVGYVLWLVRGGVLLSSLLSTLPAWRLIDPLPILGTLKRRDEHDDDDSLEGLLKKSAAESAPTPNGEKND